MMFTAVELQVILDALAKVYGLGYSDEPGIAQLQAKLSVMLEVASRRNLKPL